MANVNYVPILEIRKHSDIKYDHQLILNVFHIFFPNISEIFQQYSYLFQ